MQKSCKLDTSRSCHNSSPRQKMRDKMTFQQPHGFIKKLPSCCIPKKFSGCTIPLHASTHQFKIHQMQCYCTAVRVVGRETERVQTHLATFLYISLIFGLFQTTLFHHLNDVMLNSIFLFDQLFLFKHYLLSVNTYMQSRNNYMESQNPHIQSIEV